MFSRTPVSRQNLPILFVSFPRCFLRLSLVSSCLFSQHVFYSLCPAVRSPHGVAVLVSSDPVQAVSCLRKFPFPEMLPE